MVALLFRRMGRCASAVLARPALILAVAWVVGLAWFLPLSQLRKTGGDEGVELAKADYLLRSGTFPESVWNDQPLTQTRVYSAALAYFPGPLLPRLWSLVHAGLLLLALARVTELLFGGGMAPVAAAGCLACLPLTLDLSIAAMQEVPMTAWGMASVALAFDPRCAGSRRLLTAAVLCGVLSLSIKLTGAIFVLSACLGLMASARVVGDDSVSAVRMARRAGWIYLLGAVAGLRGLLFWWDGRPMENLLTDHFLCFGQAAEPWVRGFADRLGQAAIECTVLVPLAGWGLWERVRSLGWSAAWDLRYAALAGCVGVFQCLIQPWWSFYALSVGLVLAPWCGCAVAAGMGHLRRLLRGPHGDVFRGAQAVRLGVVAVCLGLGVVRLTDRIIMWRAGELGAASRIAGIIRSVRSAKPEPCMFSMDAMDAFWARTPLPPELLVLTQKRFLSGDITTGQIANVIRARGCEWVVIPQGWEDGAQDAWRKLMQGRFVLAAIAEQKELYVHRDLHPEPFRSRQRW